MLNDIIKIAKEAGEIVRNGFGKHLDIEYKTNEINLVTQIDKASERYIVNFITKNYPTHNILGEEGTKTEHHSDYLWVIDPLDGTTNFAHGLPIFSVSIGLLKNGEKIAGAVYDVMSDIIYTSEKGSGSFANNVKLHVNSNSIFQHAFLVTGFPYNVAENPNGAFERFVNITKSARAVRRLGSAALDLCNVAKGVFDAFWEIELHPWDMAAGFLIVEEAGGKITDFNGNNIDIFNKQMVASNSALHDEMLKYLKIDNI